MKEQEHSQPPRHLKLAACLLNLIELSAINKARHDGWFEVGAEISERALNRWMHECEHQGKPFATLRRDGARSVFWFILPAGRRWNDKGQALVERALRLTTGTIITSQSARGFLPVGGEMHVFRELFAVNSISAREQPRREEGPKRFEPKLKRVLTI